MDQIRELLDELRDNWDDPYWWADHQALQAALLAVLVGVIDLFFVYAKVRVQRAARMGETA